MTTFNVSAGTWIGAQRMSLGLEQRRLAQMIGISAQYLCDIEMGRRALRNPDLILKISAALGMSADPLFFAAGLLPPDVQGKYSTERIRAAFDAMREVLRD